MASSTGVSGLRGAVIKASYSQGRFDTLRKQILRRQNHMRTRTSKVDLLLFLVVVVALAMAIVLSINGA